MIEIKLALLTLATVPPYTAGYVAGVAMRAVTWIRAAGAAGYRKGRGV